MPCPYFDIYNEKCEMSQHFCYYSDGVDPMHCYNAIDAIDLNNWPKLERNWSGVFMSDDIDSCIWKPGNLLPRGVVL